MADLRLSGSCQRETSPGSLIAEVRRKLFVITLHRQTSHMSMNEGDTGCLQIYSRAAGSSRPRDKPGWARMFDLRISA